MPTLPSPSGGFNPWGTTLQQPQQPAPNPVVSSLLDERAARLKQEGAERVAMLGQLGQLVPALGGGGIISALEQTMSRNGGEEGAVPGLQIDEAFAMRNDPATIRGQEAQSTLQQAQALNQAAQVGSGLELGDDATINRYGPLDDRSVSIMERFNTASSPKTYYNTQTQQDNTTKATRKYKMPQQMTDGTWTYVEVELSQEQANKYQQEGVDLQPLGQPQVPDANADGAGTNPNMQGATQTDQFVAQQIGVPPGDMQKWITLQRVVQSKYGQQYYLFPPQNNGVMTLVNIQNPADSREFTQQELEELRNQ